MSQIIPDSYLPENQFKLLLNYFFDSHWEWGATWQSYTIALDLVVSVLLAFAVGLFLFKVPRHQLADVFSKNMSAVVLGLIIGVIFFCNRNIHFHFIVFFRGANFIQFLFVP